MTEAQDVKKETLSVTTAVFHALLLMTGGDSDLHMPKKRRLIEALHQAAPEGGARWCLTLTEEDVRTAYDHLEAYCLNRKNQRTRLMGVMCQQSKTFELLYREAEQKRWEGKRK